VAASGLALDVLGEEMGGAISNAASKSGRARMIIDPIDGKKNFARDSDVWHADGDRVEREIVAGFASAPGFGARWWAYRGEAVSRRKENPRFECREVEGCDVFTTGTGPSKNRRPRRKSGVWRTHRAKQPGLRRIWQHMLLAEGAIEAALDWTSKPWDLAPLGIIVEEAGGHFDKSSRRENDLFGPISEHERQDS